MKHAPVAGQHLSFQAELENWAEGMDYCAVPVPAKITEALGTKGPVLVMARINHSAEFQATLFPVGGGRHYIRVKAKVSKETGTKVGDRTEVQITVLDHSAADIPEDIEQLNATEVDRPTLSPVVAARTILENPYAYLTGAGTYELPTMPEGNGQAQPASPRRYRLASPPSAPRLQARKPRTSEVIEADVRRIHEQVWSNRVSLWSEAVPADPVDLLDPEIALQLLGYDFQYVEGLGQIRGSSPPIEVAGLIDTESKSVRVAMQFPGAIRRFTAAHELGHAVLHPNLGVLHQDKALNGAGASNDPIEIEANRFATLFLMPSKLVRLRFASIFKAEQFQLTEESAFALSGQSSSAFTKFARTLRETARRLASAERYNGRHVVPLHAQFGVSREAMAIRVEELALVRVDA